MGRELEETGGKAKRKTDVGKGEILKWWSNSTIMGQAEAESKRFFFPPLTERVAYVG